ncbi:D-alanyl-D-alanine carboxypeptidase family protein [Cellulomonas sp.]|uniref:D-alanyl-D-alanine carboxypeptidase family protein n=1 Tax=Cellulomonas sp. TaxID=40001 RepID=UPI00258A90D8|nr:D-alanyl-D-alanine carboxypeptidase family protein [Cellulomonas sp.]MCR6688412.1 D-alanyl-D-alanine carboxypeptidase family protein [Cellulomonas sp.]
MLVALVLAVGVNQAARVAADAVGPQGGSTAGDRTGDAEHAATGLDPELERRFAAAQDAAAADGVTLVLNSGWRSADEQRRIVRDAVDKYGSEREAHRWVLPARHSAHVQGLAVDVGPPEGAQWLAEHGETLGLCRTYENEPWHFEPLPAGADTCPPMHPDSSWGWS